MLSGPTMVTMLALSVGLLGSAPTPAQTERRREATPNIVFLFPRRAPADSPAQVAAALARYNRTEGALLAAEPLSARALAAHWRTLARIRMRLERLERADRLSNDARLHGELSRLLEHPVHLSIVGNDPAVELLRIAEERRLRDLVGIAQLANRRLGFHVQEVLGMPVTSGES